MKVESLQAMLKNLRNTTRYLRDQANSAFGALVKMLALYDNFSKIGIRRRLSCLVSAVECC